MGNFLRSLLLAKLKKDLPNRFSCGIIDELSGCGAAGRGEMPPPVADEGIASR